jgi:hypothetical protein
LLEDVDTGALLLENVEAGAAYVDIEDVEAEAA